MKILIIFFSLLFVVSSYAEHDANYCGKALPGNLGTTLRGNKLLKTDFDIILEVKCDSYVLQETYSGYAGVYGLTSKQVYSVFEAGKKICINARWGGPNPCDNASLADIETSTDSVFKITTSR